STRARTARRGDGAHPDSDVEDAALLVLVDALLREPRVDGRALPVAPVDLGATALGHDAGEVAEDAAAGDVGERLHVCLLSERPHLVQVEPVRSEQEVGVEIAVADELPHELEPVRVQPGGWKAEDDVARLDARPVDQPLAIDEPNACADEVELLALVDPGQLGRLAAENCAAGRS